jgi:hypothetical protein
MDILTPSERAFIQSLISQRSEGKEDLQDETLSLLRLVESLTSPRRILDHVQRLMEETRVATINRVVEATVGSDEELLAVLGEPYVVSALVGGPADDSEPHETRTFETLHDLFSALTMCWCNGEPPCPFNCPEIYKGKVFRERQLGHQMTGCVCWCGVEHNLVEDF